MLKDYHIHTIVSDGYIIPEELFRAARKIGIKEVSITDHDAIGAYSNFGDSIFEQAKKLGVKLIPGIELDSKYNGVEVHILGYYFDLNNANLKKYLNKVQTLRRERVKDQIKLLNTHLGKKIIKEEDVFNQYRDTMMKPHLVRILLDRGMFTDYRSAAKWLSEVAFSKIEVPKPESASMIRLIKEADGKAVLAHPGYYIKEHNQDLDDMLKSLIKNGLDGVEVEYRYCGTSSVFPDKGSEDEMVGFVRARAEHYGLWQTRGSDAHKLEEMEIFNSHDKKLF